MPDVIKLLMEMVNLPAAMLGVAAAQAWNYFTPTTSTEPFHTTGGGWRARLVPLIAPLAATIASVILEWDGRLLAHDVSRGILSGFASEFMLRVYYKTIKGM